MHKLSQRIHLFFSGRFRIASVVSIGLLAILLLQGTGVSAKSISQEMLQGSQGTVGVSQTYFSDMSYSILSYGGFNAVVETVPVSAGTYIVTATEVAAVDTNDVITCYFSTNHGDAAGNYYGAFGPASTYQWATITVTDRISVSAGDQIELLCLSNNNDANTYSYHGAISATQLNAAGSNALNAVGSNALPSGQGHKPLPLPRLHH